MLLLRKPLKRLSQAYIGWRVACCVKKAEKKFPEPKSGAQKKAWVLDRTQKYEAQLLKMNKTIDDIIENAVAILKTRNMVVQKSLQTAASVAIGKNLSQAASAVVGKTTTVTDTIGKNLTGKD